MAQSRKYLVFCRNFSKLTKGISDGLGEVVREAFSRALIPLAIQEECSNYRNPTDERAARFLKAILAKIQLKETFFDDFVSILDRVPSKTYLAEILNDDLDSERDSADVGGREVGIENRISRPATAAKRLEGDWSSQRCAREQKCDTKTDNAEDPQPHQSTQDGYLVGPALLTHVPSFSSVHNSHLGSVHELEAELKRKEKEGREMQAEIKAKEREIETFKENEQALRREIEQFKSKRQDLRDQPVTPETQQLRKGYDTRIEVLEKVSKRMKDQAVSSQKHMSILLKRKATLTSESNELNIVSDIPHSTSKTDKGMLSNNKHGSTFTRWGDEYATDNSHVNDRELANASAHPIGGSMSSQKEQEVYQPLQQVKTDSKSPRYVEPAQERQRNAEMELDKHQTASGTYEHQAQQRRPESRSAESAEVRPVILSQARKGKVSSGHDDQSPGSDHWDSEDDIVKSKPPLAFPNGTLASFNVLDSDCDAHGTNSEPSDLVTLNSVSANPVQEMYPGGFSEEVVFPATPNGKYNVQQALHAKDSQIDGLKTMVKEKTSSEKALIEKLENKTQEAEDLRSKLKRHRENYKAMEAALTELRQKHEESEADRKKQLAEIERNHAAFDEEKKAATQRLQDVEKKYETENRELLCQLEMERKRCRGLEDKIEMLNKDMKIVQVELENMKLRHERDLGSVRRDSELNRAEIDRLKYHTGISKLPQPQQNPSQEYLHGDHDPLQLLPH